MKKNILYTLVGAVIVVLAWITTHQLDLTNNKVVVIDSQKVLEDYKGFKEAKDVYELKVKEMKDSFNKQRSIFESKGKEFEILMPKLNEEEKSNKKIELARLREELLKSGTAIENQSSEIEDKLMKGISNKVNDFVKRFGEREGYEVILGANGQGNVIYVDGQKDITQLVINKLNQEYAEGI